MGKGLKIPALVLGIVCLVLGWFSICSLFTLPMAIAALVLACVGNKKGKDGLGTAAFVVSLIALILNALLFFTCGLCSLCVICEAKQAANGLNNTINGLY